MKVDPFALDREIVRRFGLYGFMRSAWHVVQSTPFVPGWHLEEVCTHLEAVSNNELDRLVINVPPGTGKSLTVSVFWQAWDWIISPWKRFMFASFDPSLTQRDAKLCKELLNSEWYQKRWGLLADQKALEAEGHKAVFIQGEPRQNTASVYWSNGGGLRFSTSMKGKATGWHAHVQVIDDPTKPKDVQLGGKWAMDALTRTIETYKSTFATRKADPKMFARVIIMQRLHENDLSGYVLQEGGYTHLRLPMEYRADRPCRTQWGGDRRAVEGELLCPERYDAKSVATTRKDLGPIDAAAQLDQEPSPAAGAIFRREWFNKRWSVLPSGCRWIQSWDMAFKDESTSDYVVGIVLAQRGGDFYLVGRVRDRMDHPTTCQAMRDQTRRWPQAIRKLVEDKANGPAVAQALKHEITGIVLVTPEGGKVARANAVAGIFEAGNFYLPNEPWVEEYIEEMVKFPKGRNDDQVDATTQALVYLTAKPKNRMKEAMQRARL